MADLTEAAETADATLGTFWAAEAAAEASFSGQAVGQTTAGAPSDLTGTDTWPAEAAAEADLSGQAAGVLETVDSEEAHLNAPTSDLTDPDFSETSAARDFSADLTLAADGHTGTGRAKRRAVETATGTSSEGDFSADLTETLEPTETTAKRSRHT